MKLRKGILALGLGVAMITTGCTAAWLGTFEGYLKIAGPILIQILDIYALAKGAVPNAQAIAKIQADQAAVNTLAVSAASASSQNVAGTCAQFNLAVATFATDLPSIDQLSGIKDASKQAQIAALVSLAQATIQEVEAPIAACQGAPNSQMAMARLQAGALRLQSPSAVVKKFNALTDAKHHIHLHSAVERYATFGLLK